MKQFVDTINLHEIYYTFLLFGESKFCSQSMVCPFLEKALFLPISHSLYILTLSFPKHERRFSNKLLCY
jgi:hypothetical protein